MPPRREPETLRSAALGIIISDIEYHVRVLFSCSQVVARETLGFLQKVMMSLPYQLVTELSWKALSCADQLAEAEVRPLTTAILQRFVLVVIPENTIEFKTARLHSYQVRQAVANRICKLPFLRVYHNLQHHHENVHTLPILQNLRSLSSLTEIYLPQWFTDKIAHLLGRSCPNLQLLDAGNSRFMTDESVLSLKHCKDLKVLIASSTGLSANGYQELLGKLPHLQKIGYCDKLNAIVSNVRKNHEAAMPLSLLEYESDEAPDRNTLTLCPNLCTVICNNDLSRSTELPHNVVKLVAQDMNYIGNGLNRMLNSNIIRLELIKCKVTEDIVAAIAASCVNLRHLRLDSEIEDDLSLRTEEREPFRRLETLDITHSILATEILVVARNIRCFRSRPSLVNYGHDLRWTSDMFEAVMVRNPMKHLESFLVPVICTTSVNKMIEFVRACPKLRTIGRICRFNFGSWLGGLDSTPKITEFLCAIKKENLDVTIV